MGWKIIEVEEGQYLSLFLDNLVIEYKDNKITIPLNSIDTIISQNYKLVFTSRLICELSKHNINFIICDTNHLPACQLQPFFGNYNTLKIFNNQLSWTSEYKNFLWKNIVKQKIINQAKFVKFLLNDLQCYQKLISLSLEVKDFDVSNREGHAAKIYWHRVYGLNFNRNSDLPINHLLNYGYALLRSMFCRSIVKKGLDPRIFLFHNSFNNSFALASDLMEVLRIVIDINVFLQVKKDPNSSFYDCKQELNKYLSEVKVNLNGKNFYLNNAIDFFIDSILNKENFPIFDFFWEQTYGD